MVRLWICRRFNIHQSKWRLRMRTHFGHEFHQDFLVHKGRVFSGQKRSFNMKRRSEGALRKKQRPSWRGKRPCNLEVGWIKQKNMGWTTCLIVINWTREMLLIVDAPMYQRWQSKRSDTHLKREVCWSDPNRWARQNPDSLRVVVSEPSNL